MITADRAIERTESAIKMLIAIVEIPMARKATKQDAIDRAKKAAPTYVDLGQKGLIRKYFLNGDASGGGVYLWESREAAEAWYTNEWYDWIEERFDARPKLSFFDNYVVVDNLADEAIQKIRRARGFHPTLPFRATRRARACTATPFITSKG